MVKKEVKELPEKIATMGLVSHNLDEFKRKKQNLVDAYNSIRNFSIEAVPLDPREITAERLTAYVEKMKATIPEDNKQGRLVWDNMLSDALMEIKHIREFFAAFPSAEFEVNLTLQPENRLKCKNAMEAIDAVSSVDIPAECKAYWDKVKAVGDALYDMYEWEKNHNLQKRPVEEMAYYAVHADEFAQQWLDGYFNKDSVVTGMGTASIVVGNRKS